MVLLHILSIYLLMDMIFSLFCAYTVIYLQSNPGGITIFGWAVDRALINTFFFIELTLVLFVLGKTIILAKWPSTCLTVYHDAKSWSQICPNSRFELPSNACHDTYWHLSTSVRIYVLQWQSRHIYQPRWGPSLQLSLSPSIKCVRWNPLILSTQYECIYALKL